MWPPPHPFHPLSSAGAPGTVTSVHKCHCCLVPGHGPHPEETRTMSRGSRWAVCANIQTAFRPHRWASSSRFPDVERDHTVVCVLRVRLIGAGTRVSSSFLLKAVSGPVAQRDPAASVRPSPVSGPLGCSHLVAAVKVCVVVGGTPACTPLGRVPRRGSASSHGDSWSEELPAAPVPELAC